MTKNQAVKALKEAGFADAASTLKAVWEKLEAAKGQKDCGWSPAEAIGDYVRGTGTAMSDVLSGQIKTALNRVIQEAATRKNMSPGSIWGELRPLWQAWCNDDEAPTYGPEVFARNPRKWTPKALSVVGAYSGPKSERLSHDESEKLKQQLFANVGKVYEPKPDPAKVDVRMGRTVEG